MARLKRTPYIIFTEFVSANQKMKIKKVLIANRGEIAVRIIKTLRRLNIETVVVHHAVDRKSRAVELADEAVELMGDLPVASYLDMEQIIAAAKSTGADAVHPGYGFLSENAEFADRLTKEGIIFVGPSAEVINMMGNKVQARSYCIENGFPIVPSVVDYGDEAAFIKAVKGMGVPLLIKAAAGGGGKGMQIVRDSAEIENSIALARGEALRSFGNSLVYAERYIDEARHIEVQIMADQFGNVLHLGERECSIQRRFQKVIEEAPSPALDDAKRKAMCETATRIAKKANYSNAGTVEFIYTPEGEFFFLEMNTRIQVEHPVTEMITGVDLIEMQVRVATGDRLDMTQDDIKLTGHSIETRLYAEDTENDFAPSIGQLLVYDLPHDSARIENGFIEGQKVTSAFDPMLVKIVVHGKDRAEAISKAIEALKKSCVLGVTTNRDFLIRVLEHAAFGAGKTHTGFIKEHEADLKAADLTADQLDILLSAAALATPAFNDSNLRAPEPVASMGAWGNQ